MVSTTFIIYLFQCRLITVHNKMGKKTESGF
uniref:Uncharacterized protein n=1 Tax=Anguilla anguilla TaxID=7936 RepID=A0A0E9RBW8_ANGAN